MQKAMHKASLENNTLMVDNPPKVLYIIIVS
jgi:hypothetical protein